MLKIYTRIITNMPYVAKIMGDKMILDAEEAVSKIIDNGNQTMYNYLFGGYEVTKENWKHVIFSGLREAAVKSVEAIRSYPAPLTTEEFANDLFDDGADNCVLTFALASLVTINDLSLAGHIDHLQSGIPAEKVDANRVRTVLCLNDNFILKTWIAYASMIF